ncbi:hypothetical protein OZX72_08145 [Bifidobacterium sp. ESL0769]|uniref:YwqH-like family protein n=1 Tax=Bifidobacterium sp. ESL0769 TaxID=2983229 RepID=UPI0023F9A038|nr:hypothetical protein [Bifidobacterium sp. ESL0769]WEV67196.1 hypothetical protein OZX72_08145 [Bifidobacterium sp. ESL0769]
MAIFGEATMPYSDNLRADIARTDRHISDLSDQLNAAKEKLKRLQELLSYVTHRQDSFLNEQGRKQSSFKQIWEHCANSQSAVNYSNVMGDVLFGNKPNNIASSYSDGISHTNDAIRKTEEEIGDLQHSITNAENYRADQVNHLQRVMAEEQWSAQKAAMQAKGAY